MRCIKIFGMVAAGLLLSGCASSFQDWRPIKEDRILSVIGEIKRQIGVYVQFQNSPQGYEAVWQNSREMVCGNGLVGFDIKSVKMELLSTTDATVGATIGVAYPPITGGMGFSRTTTDSQTLVVDYDVLPSRFRSEFSDAQLLTAPIAALMKNLWTASLKSGDQETHVCLRMKQASATGNTLKIAITVVDDGHGNIGVGLANVSVGASGDFKSTTGNTITVTFAPHTFSEFRNRREYPGRLGRIGVNKYDPANPTEKSKKSGCPPQDTSCKNIQQKRGVEE